MSAIKVGDAAPDISAVDQSGELFRLSDYRDRQAVVLFFYPADYSPVCTKEVCSFRDAYQQFVDAGAAVIGVSGDAQATHQQFASRHSLPFRLITDADGAMRKAFGVTKSWGLLPGRVTYVIDRHGIVQHLFSAQFTADRHVDSALQIVEQLNRHEDSA